jgi:hypothetical protein
MSIKASELAFLAGALVYAETAERRRVQTL